MRKWTVSIIFKSAGTFLVLLRSCSWQVEPAKGAVREEQNYKKRKQARLACMSLHRHVQRQHGFFNLLAAAKRRSALFGLFPFL